MADHDERTLVVVFLRGGLDGLNAVVPHFEDPYYGMRPALALEAPKPGVKRDGLLPLDERFALNPGLEALLPAYNRSPGVLVRELWLESYAFVMSQPDAETINVPFGARYVLRIPGLENAPRGLIGLLAGENRGKRMIRVGTDQK